MPHTPEDLSPALLEIARDIEALKRPCSTCPESAIAIQNSRYMGVAQKVRALAALTSPTPALPAERGETEALDCYDAGLLNDFGGGNVDWWQDYIRADLGRAHDFYESQVAALRPQSAPTEAGGVAEALKWTAAALQAIVRRYEVEGVISRLDNDEQKPLADVLDMADEALSTLPAPSPAAGAESYVMFPNVDGKDNDVLYPERAGNWQQYAKDGETAQDVIERERKDSAALCTLLAEVRRNPVAAVAQPVAINPATLHEALGYAEHWATFEEKRGHTLDALRVRKVIAALAASPSCERQDVGDSK